DRWLGEAEAVDTARDGFKRLIHSLLAHVSDHGRFHDQQIAVRLSRSRGHDPIRELIVDEIAELSGSRRIDIAHQDVRIVYAADFAKADVLVVELPLEVVDCRVAPLADSLLELHLQDEVAATLQIEAELDAIRKILL